MYLRQRCAPECAPVELHTNHSDQRAASQARGRLANCRRPASDRRCRGLLSEGRFEELAPSKPVSATACRFQPGAHDARKAYTGACTGSSLAHVGISALAGWPVWQGKPGACLELRARLAWGRQRSYAHPQPHGGASVARRSWRCSLRAAARAGPVAMGARTCRMRISQARRCLRKLMGSPPPAGPGREPWPSSSSSSTSAPQAVCRTSALLPSATPAAHAHYHPTGASSLCISSWRRSCVLHCLRLAPACGAPALQYGALRPATVHARKAPLPQK